MNQKLRLLVLCGGQSAEHEVSLLSANSVIKVLDLNRYELFIVGIKKNGEWAWHSDHQGFLEHPNDPKKVGLRGSGEPVTLIPTSDGPMLIRLSDGQTVCRMDVAFPILHGPFGEDGTIQGFLKMVHLPFVGASVLGSGIGMDKSVTKRLLRDAGLPTAKFLVFRRSDTIDFAAVERTLGLPMFVKPANMGSSVGISKINDQATFLEKVEGAFAYDDTILIESGVVGREIECSVLGNEAPMVSLPGEIIPQHEFYSYEAKYLDDQGAKLEFPAKLTPSQIERMQALAIQTYQVLQCEGMARVDFFLTPDDRFLVNELNTLPGFTKISMYPKLWAVSGLPYADLVQKLIELALERFHRESRYIFKGYAH